MRLKTVYTCGDWMASSPSDVTRLISCLPPCELRPSTDMPLAFYRESKWHMYNIEARGNRLVQYELPESK